MKKDGVYSIVYMDAVISHGHKATTVEQVKDASHAEARTGAAAWEDLNRAAGCHPYTTKCESSPQEMGTTILYRITTITHIDLNLSSNAHCGYTYVSTHIIKTTLGITVSISALAPSQGTQDHLEL